MGKKNNQKHLRIAGLLQILMGVIYIVGMRLILSGEAGNVTLSQSAAEGALTALVLFYVANGFKILAGLWGVCLAGKRSAITVVFGFLLFIAQLVGFVQVKDDVVQIIIHAVLLAIPYYYLHNAVKVFWRKED